MQQLELHSKAASAPLGPTILRRKRHLTAPGPSQLWPAQLCSTVCPVHLSRMQHLSLRQHCVIAFNNNSNDSSTEGHHVQSVDPNSNNSSSSSTPEAWSLMGRVVSSDRLVIGAGGRQRLVLLAAAKHAGITPEEMTHRLQELLTLLPDLSPSLLVVLNPSTLAALTSNTAAVADKLIQIRLMFPGADVSQMISKRPTLLLDGAFEQIEVARAKLIARLTRVPQPLQQQQQQSPGSSSSSNTPTNNNILGTTGSSTAASSSSSVLGSSSDTPGTATAVLDGLVSRQPLLLVDYVDELLDELERLLPAVDVTNALLRNPDIVLNVMCNRKLSIWLLPGTAVLSLLQSNPDMLYMAQRGTRWLGPGAEFMGPG